jgi:hypothetical protein
MSMVSAAEFADAFGIAPRVARKAFARAAGGHSRRGRHLPVQRVPKSKGGRSGEAWVLHLDAACPALRAKLIPAVEGPVQRGLKDLPRQKDVATAGDRWRIIAPIIAHAKGSAERAAALAKAAEMPHAFGGRVVRLAVRTLRDWVKAHEEGGLAALMARPRRDKGRARVSLSRARDKGCGLSDRARASVAAELEGFARGLLAKGVTERRAHALCGPERCRLTRRAGCNLPEAQLARVGLVGLHRVRRFAEMKNVAAFDRDHRKHIERLENSSRVYWAHPHQVFLAFERPPSNRVEPLIRRAFE